MSTLRNLMVCSLWVGLAATSCAREPVPSRETSVQERASGPAFPLGRTFVYAMSWTVDAGFEGSGSPVGLPLAGGLQLEGELHVQAIDERDDGTLAAIWFDALSTRELIVNGEHITVEPDALAGQRAYFVIDKSGGVPRAWFGLETSSLFRHVMGGALARFDLRGVLAGAGTHVVPTGNGLAEVTYAHADAPGTVRRDLQEIVRFDALGGLDAAQPEVEGVVELALDSDRIPVRIDSREDAVVADRGWRFGSHDRFHAERRRIDDSSPIAAPDDLASYTEHVPGAVPDPRESERMLAQRFAEGLGVHDVANAVAAIDGGLLPSGRFITRATGLMRGWPDEARAMIPVALGAGRHGRQLAFDVLAAGGTVEAQAVMRELLERDEVRASPELPLLVGRFAFVNRPTIDTAQFLLALHDDAREAGDDRLASAILYPLGSVAGAIEHTDPWVAEQLHARVVDVLDHAEDVPTRLAAIAALGNHGRQSDHARLVGLLSDDDHAVRAKAATALRSMVTPEATAALVDALRDADRDVASNALDVLAEHHYGPEGSAVLAAVVIAGRHNDDIETALVNALSSRIGDDASVRVALREIATRTTDRELVARIGGLVDS